VYLTLAEAIKKSGYTEIQFLQCIAAGRICPITVTDKGEFPVEDAREKADRLTERHYIIMKKYGDFYNEAENDHNYNVQESIEHYREESLVWRFIESDCDPEIIELTVKPKVYANDQRIPIIIKAISKKGVDRWKVPARGGTIKRIREWCEENYPELFPLGPEGHSKNIFDKVWKSGKEKHWKTVPAGAVK